MDKQEETTTGGPRPRNCRRGQESSSRIQTSYFRVMLGGFWVLVMVISCCSWVPPLTPSFHVQAFAAKKKSGGGKSGSSSTNKGFGAPPPSLESILAKFPTRIPQNVMDPATLDCPCGNRNPTTGLALTYGECCGPLHEKKRQCTTMTDVLRSRYSAFCWRNIRHVMDTTHESCSDWRADRIAWAKDLNKDGMFDSFEFVNLQILGPEELSDDHETTNEGFLEFQVTIRGRAEDDILRGGTTRRSAAAVAGLETMVKERSKFLRDPETGVWSYASGDVTSQVAGLEDTKLNN